MFRKIADPKPHPDFVPSMLECFDNADPTRSHEAKPSQRLRNRYALRRDLWRIVKSLALVVAVVALIVMART